MWQSFSRSHSPPSQNHGHNCFWIFSPYLWKFYNYLDILHLFGNVTIKSHMFPGISSEADEVEIALDEVDDHVPPNILLVLCRRVVSEIYCSLVAINYLFLMIVIWLPLIPFSDDLLVFHLNDGLSKVLQASTLGWSSTDVNHLVRQNLQLQS